MKIIKNYINYINYIKNIKNINILNYINYLINGIILIIWLYLYYIGSLTIDRILVFFLVFFLIYFYSRFGVFIYSIFLKIKVIKYIENNSESFRKIVYILLEIYKWINPLIVFLTYTEKLLYKINRYITGTRFIHYNFVIYVLVKYLVMFGLIKLIIYKYYNVWYKLYESSIVEILFKRMYGLILSILIFTDLLNNIISYISHYGIWIYIFIYYLISTLCIIWELLYFYYLWYKITNKKLCYLLILFDQNFQSYTKMNVTVFFRGQFTWLGCIITSILDIIVLKENNFKWYPLFRTKITEGSSVGSGFICYYIPLENRMPLKYFDYFGEYKVLDYIEPKFELYWESFKIKLLYHNFFKPIREIKGKPSIFLYKYLQDLANLLDIHNQPINRLMNWIYYDMKSNKSSKFIEDTLNIYNEPLKLMDENEKIVVNKNLLYLKKVDDLRAKLIFFILWDIEYYNNNNNKDYIWDYWMLQYDSIMETYNFKMDKSFSFNLLSKNLEITNKFMFNNKNLLKFYDVEDNMEYFNRLFNVLGIIDLSVIGRKYYVSEKFNNYNERYVELMNIIHFCEFKRCYEQRCECKYISLYEVEIAYKTEKYFQDLRKEWEGNITKEGLEDRNWRLLKEVEGLMVPD